MQETFTCGEKGFLWDWLFLILCKIRIDFLILSDFEIRWLRYETCIFIFFEIWDCDVLFFEIVKCYSLRLEIRKLPMITPKIFFILGDNDIRQMLTWNINRTKKSCNYFACHQSDITFAFYMHYYMKGMTWWTEIH